VVKCQCPTVPLGLQTLEIDVIYFIQDSRTLEIKIGYTGADVMVRLNALQTGNASKLEVIACVPGELTDEARLHVKFAAARVGGEWFRPSPDLLRHLAFVVIGQGMSDEARESGYKAGFEAGFREGHINGIIRAGIAAGKMEHERKLATGEVAGVPAIS
jgi:hypothetical protein